MAEPQNNQRYQVAVMPPIKRWETQSGEGMGGKFSVTQNMEFKLGDNRGIYIQLCKFGFKYCVDGVRIYLFDGVKMDHDEEEEEEEHGLFEIVMEVKRNNSCGAFCRVGNETCSGRDSKYSMDNVAYRMPGSDSEIYSYGCRNPWAQGSFVVQKESKNTTTFVDTIVATHYMIVEKVGTFVVTIKVETNGGATLGVHMEGPALYPSDFGEKKVRKLMDQYEIKNKKKTAIKSGDSGSRLSSNSGAKSSSPTVAVSCNTNTNSGDQINNSGRVDGNYNGAIIKKKQVQVKSLFALIFGVQGQEEKA